MQLSAAKHLRWMPEKIEITPTTVHLYGWALTVWEKPEQIRFLINGRDFETVDWPISSPDIHTHFDVLPNTEASRFRCTHTLREGESVYEDGFIRFNVTGELGEHRKSYRTAWFVSDPSLEQSTPSAARIERVIGTSNLDFFMMGGATMLNRIQHLLQDRFDRSMGSFKSVLDWGCGAGRLTRYLPRFAPRVTGVDIDPDNVLGCTQSIASARFQQVDLFPPMPFEQASFDLVIGISVLTHLEEPVQDAWLAELQRIVEPGGLVLLSIQGMPQSALYRMSVERQKAVQQQGIFHAGRNAQLDQVIDAPNYYVDMIHSHDYVMTHWGRYFDVLEIVESIAGNQDLVVMRKR